MINCSNILIQHLNICYGLDIYFNIYKQSIFFVTFMFVRPLIDPEYGIREFQPLEVIGINKKPWILSYLFCCYFLDCEEMLNVFN